MIKNYNIYLSNYRGLIYVKTESDFIIDSNNKLKKEKLTEINNTHTAAFINDLCNPNNKEYIKGIDRKKSAERHETILTNRKKERNCKERD